MLGHFTLGRSYPMRERLAAAREAGVAGVGLFMADLERCASEGISDDDLADHARRARVTVRRPRPDQPGAARPGDRRTLASVSSRRAVELADRFGCRYLQTIAPNAEPGAAGFDETIDALGSVADALAPFDVEVGLEYAGFTTIRTPPRRSPSSRHVDGRTSASASTSGTTPAARHDVALAPSVPASMIRCVQLNDGPLVPEEPDYKTDCVRNRWHPAPARWTSPASSTS